MVLKAALRSRRIRMGCDRGEFDGGRDRASRQGGVS